MTASFIIKFGSDRIKTVVAISNPLYGPVLN